MSRRCSSLLYHGDLCMQYRYLRVYKHKIANVGIKIGIFIVNENRNTCNV